MPEISRFFGIIIAMFYNDHNPPHFHATYGASKATIRIDPVGLMEGHLPPRALAMVVEWASIHQAELLANWQRRTSSLPLVKIDPLT